LRAAAQQWVLVTMRHASALKGALRLGQAQNMGSFTPR
jgi:hypothetical protein